MKLVNEAVAATTDASAVKAVLLGFKPFAKQFEKLSNSITSSTSWYWRAISGRASPGFLQNEN